MMAPQENLMPGEPIPDDEWAQVKLEPLSQSRIEITADVYNLAWRTLRINDANPPSPMETK